MDSDDVSASMDSTCTGNGMDESEASERGSLLGVVRNRRRRTHVMVDMVHNVVMLSGDQGAARWDQEQVKFERRPETVLGQLQWESARRNGETERAIWRVQGQNRTVKAASEVQMQETNHG